MARSTQWRRTCNDLVFWRQTQALNATIYILRETGPTGFLLKEEGESKPCKAFLGDPHSCTCSQFLKDRDLCKHICWLLLKKFRVPQTDSMSWQKGLVERDINNILRGLAVQQRKKVSTAVKRWRRPLSADGDTRETIAQRDIAEDDVCPICQDELLAKRLPVTYCKFGCGNSIHIKCMKVWAEHQKTQGETTVKCPFCREDFGPFELLKSESRNATGPVPGGRMDRHLGTNCQSCHTSPIEGKCYRCSSCADFHLCQSCFNTQIHTQHGFEYRHKRNQRWRPAQRSYGAVLPQAVVDDLVNREISENDYDLLMQLESNAQNQSDIPEQVIQSFPLEKVRANGPLLAPGMQCRVCLRGYQVGQLIRKIPRCKHRFHKECIDNWLLHSRPTCPVDGAVVWDPATAELEQESQPSRDRHQKRQSSTVSSDTGLTLEVPGMGMTLRAQEMNRQAAAQQHQQARGRAPLRRQRERGGSDPAVHPGLRSSFTLSGNAVGQDEAVNGHVGPSASLPGARLLQRLSTRRAVNAQRMNSMPGSMEDVRHQADLVSTAIGQEELDPLEQVIEANSLPNQSSPDVNISHGSPGNQRRSNPGSLFASDTVPQHDMTSTLLNNFARISAYEDMPNAFHPTMQNGDSDSLQHHDQQNHSSIGTDQMALESTRTNETVGSSSKDIAGQRLLHQETNGQAASQVIPPPTTVLFADTPPAVTSTAHHVSQSRCHAKASQNPPPSVQNEVTRELSVTVPGGLPRQVQSISSAPASVGQALAGFSLPFLTALERGRGSQRGWAQSNSVRTHSSSQERNQARSLQRSGSIPSEGENLLQRLQVFSDLYLGNSPISHPALQEVTTTATGLPPRPQHRRYGNAAAAAARQRRTQNDRRKHNFSLEGNAYKDVTFRDLLR